MVVLLSPTESFRHRAQLLAIEHILTNHNVRHDVESGSKMGTKLSVGRGRVILSIVNEIYNLQF